MPPLSYLELWVHLRRTREAMAGTLRQLAALEARLTHAISDRLDIAFPDGSFDRTDRAEVTASKALDAAIDDLVDRIRAAEAKRLAQQATYQRLTTQYHEALDGLLRRERLEREGTPYAYKPSRKAPKPKPGFETWRQGVVAAAFADYAAITAFPAPPHVSFTCRQPACAAGRRALVACACELRKVFGELSREALKKERLCWHPDRFAVCAESLRTEFQKMAAEVFVVIDGLYQEAK